MTLIAYPFRPVPGDPEDVTQIMMDFDAVTAVVNGDITDVNIKPGSLTGASINPSQTPLVPTGAIFPFAGATPPGGYLLCDGASVAVSSYAALHAIIGYAYGGSGGQFNLPNFKGRIPVGQDAAQARFDVLGEAGGEADVALNNVNQMPNHSHGGNSGWQSHNHSHSGSTDTQGWHDHAPQQVGLFNVGTGGTAALGSGGTIRYLTSTTSDRTTNEGGHSHNFGTSTESQGHYHGINPEGGGQPHNNLQPYQVVNYIIKT